MQKREHQSEMDNLLTLKLRGGGASARRKEARKRKFKHCGLECARSLPVTGLKVESEAILPHLELPGQEEIQPESYMKHTSRITSEKVNPITITEQTEVQTLTSNKAQRFIVFIGSSSVSLGFILKNKRVLLIAGNLPFTTTVDSITRHFDKVKPISIRHSTVKDTAKSKGFAFLEFDKYDRMKTCLKLYHHSSFDDGVSAPRQVNVELT